MLDKFWLNLDDWHVFILLRDVGYKYTYCVCTFKGCGLCHDNLELCLIVLIMGEVCTV